MRKYVLHCPDVIFRVAAVIGVLAACFGTAPAAQAQEPAASTIILDTSGFWRAFYTLSPPVVRDGTQLLKLRTLTGQTPLPAPAWTAADFDDSSWARTPGRPFFSGRYWDTTDPAILDAGSTYNEHSSPALALICLRGKFTVTDPAAAKGLKLALKYRGGVVVYVNGKEIGRSSMAPDSPGTAGPEALAQDYPKEAFFREDGTLCGPENRNKPQLDLTAWKARVRSADITIPGDALRRGVNVLAIEVHRSAYSVEAQKWLAAKRISVYETAYYLWSTCGLLSARLTADFAAGLTPNCSRSSGLQIWNSQLLQPDFDMDFGDPNEPLRPIRIVGSRGGMFSGKVVVGSDQAIKGLAAQISDLSAEKGGAKIPTSAVKVRFALPTGWEALMPGRYPATPDLLDGLSDTAPPVVEVRTHQAKAGATWIAAGQRPWVFGAVLPGVGDRGLA